MMESRREEGSGGWAGVDGGGGRNGRRWKRGEEDVGKRKK